MIRFTLCFMVGKTHGSSVTKKEGLTPSPHFIINHCLSNKDAEENDLRDFNTDSC